MGFEPGTYQLQVCRPSCPGDPLVMGYLVLLDQVLSPADFPDSLRRDVSFGLLDPGGSTNACFSIVRRDPNIDTYAGIDPIALTHWDGPDSIIQFIRFYSSADAGYVARLHATPNGFAGEGHSWGFGYGRGKSGPAEEVIGHRLGAPEPGRCYKRWAF